MSPFGQLSVSRQPRPQGSEVPRSPLSCTPEPEGGHPCPCGVRWQWSEKGLLNLLSWADGYWGAQAGLGFPAWPTSLSDTSPWRGLPSFSHNRGHQHPRLPLQPETPSLPCWVQAPLSTSTLGLGRFKSLPLRLSFHLLCAACTLGDDQPRQQGPSGRQQTRRQGLGWARKGGSAGRRRANAALTGEDPVPTPADSTGWGGRRGGP